MSNLPMTSILWRRFPVEDVKRWIVDDAETSAQTPSKTPKAKRTVSCLHSCMLMPLMKLHFHRSPHGCRTALSCISCEARNSLTGSRSPQGEKETTCMSSSHEELIRWLALPGSWLIHSASVVICAMTSATLHATSSCTHTMDQATHPCT